jgi:aminoglycoside 6'-N-acetyltransferase I
MLYGKKTKMKIRNAKKEDLRSIAKLFLEESNKKPYNQNYTSKTIKLRVNNMFNFGSLYLALIDENIVGFIAIAGEGKEEIYIDEFWIKSEYQKKGIGSELLKFVQDKYKKKGAKAISVMTSKKAGAFKFYRAFKFKENKETVILRKKI